MTDSINHAVSDEADNRKYWTQIPNIIYEMKLSPHALVLYNVLKRTAGGNGTSWKSTTTLAEECNMSTGMVSQAKQELSQPFKSLNGKRLIRITESMKHPATKKTKPGGRPYHIITIVDIWPENMTHFSSSQCELETSNQVHNVNLKAVSSSQCEVKNNPIIEENHGVEEKPKIPPSEGANAPAALPVSFQQWLDLVQQPPGGSNCTAQLKNMHDTLFQKNDPVTFGRIGASMKRVGGAGRLCQLLWEAAPKRPNGSVLDYIDGMQRPKKYNGRRDTGRRVHF